MVKSLFLLVVSALIVFLNLGCGGTSSSGFTKENHVLIYPIPNDPTTIDPAAVEDGDTIDVLHLVFEGLVTWNTNTEPVPNLADHWDISEDGMTYTFHLKRGVKFHSGREMTANDVKYSWDRAARPEVLSPTAGDYMVDIVGFDEVKNKESESLAGVRVIDDYTLEVQIKSPKPYWIMYLEYPCYFVVDKESIGVRPMNNIKEAVGTGPYKFSEYRSMQFVDLIRNDDYHGGAPKLSRIRRLIAPDPQTRRQLFEAGEVDWVQLERQDKRLIDANPKLKERLVVVDRPAIWYIGMNLNEFPAFRDKRVRQAFAMAIDKDRIIQDGLDGVNLKAEGIIPPGIPGYDPNFRGLQFNPERAKQLLAEAGYPDGRGFPPLKLYFRVDRHDPKIVAQMVQQDLLKNLNIKVELNAMEWGALLKLRSDGKLPFFHLRWHADYPDPQNFLSFMLHSQAGQNNLGYANPEFDRLCDEADVMMDHDMRMEYYRRAEAIVVDDAIWIPIYFQRDLELLSPTVKNLERSLMGPLPHYNTDVIRN